MRLLGGILVRFFSFSPIRGMFLMHGSLQLRASARPTSGSSASLSSSKFLHLDVRRSSPSLLPLREIRMRCSCFVFSWPFLVCRYDIGNTTGNLDLSSAIASASSSRASASLTSSPSTTASANINEEMLAAEQPEYVNHPVGIMPAMNLPQDLLPYEPIWKE